MLRLPPGPATERWRPAPPASAPGPTGAQCRMARRRKSRGTCSRPSLRSTLTRPSSNRRRPPAEVPAAGPLAEVAADRTEVANLRRGDRVRRLGQARENCAAPRDDLRVAPALPGRRSATRPCGRVDPIVPANAFRFTTRAGRVMYSFIVVSRSCPPAIGRAASSASFGAGAELERADCFADRGWADPFKRFHAVLPSRIRPIRILSGVIGNSRTSLVDGPLWNERSITCQDDRQAISK